MGNRWYVSLDGEELGPLSDTGLERMIQGGRIEGDTLVRNGQTGEWTAAREVESLLAARPSRERPGQAAIEAARKAKQISPRPPSPPARIQAAQATRPAIAPATDATDIPATTTLRASEAQAVTLPAPADLPQSKAPPDDQSAAPSPALQADAVATPAARHHSPLKLVAAGAGAVLILAVSSLAGWFGLRSFASGAAATPAARPAAVDPALVALQQQAEQLRRDLAEAKQKLESPPAAPTSAAASQTQAPADQTTPPPQTTPPSQTPPPSTEPAAKTEPPAASDPGAAPKANPPAADLETQRKELAEMIALERTVADERERLQRYAEQVDDNPDSEFKSTPDSEVLEFLGEAKQEVAKLDAKQLAARREEVSAARDKRYKEAAQFEASVPSLLERIEIRQAMMAMALASILGPPEVIEQRTKRGKELSFAEPNVLYERLGKLSDSQLQRLIAEVRLPDDWPDRSDDAMIAEAMRKCAVRLAPMVYGLRQSGGFKRRFDEARQAIDLVTWRKLAFLALANVADEDGRITPAEATPIIDVFGVFDIGDLAPIVDAAPSRRFLQIVNDAGPSFITKLAQAKLQLETIRAVFEKARMAAGDAWPPDDRPHPLAGRWKGKDNWEIEIDPRQDRIVFRRSSSSAPFEQRICKIGPDHLIAYEKRKVPIERVATDPFRSEKYDGGDSFPGPDDAVPDEAIAFTYYSPSKSGTALELRRRICAAGWVQESGGKALWEIIGNPKEYREFRAAYRRVEE